MAQHRKFRSYHTALIYDNNGSMTDLVTQVGGEVKENMAYSYDFDGMLTKVEKPPPMAILPSHYL